MGTLPWNFNDARHCPSLSIAKKIVPLSELLLPHPAQKAILEECLMAIESARERIAQAEASMELMKESWHLKAALEALMAMRGFRLVAAMITVE